MTSQEALEVFGSSISCQYFHNGSYDDAVFSYNQVWSAAYGNHGGSAWTYDGNSFLEYTCNVYPSTNPQYITFDLQPLYSIFNTTQIHTCICLSVGTDSDNYSVSTTYQSPSWDWVYDGQTYHIENSAEGDLTGQFAYIRSAGQNFTFVCADLSSVSSSSGYSYRAVFSGNTSGYPMKLLIGIPYVSDSASGQTGTFTTASGGSGGDTNITVNVDMSETNEELQQQTGILSTISNWLTSFFTTLGNTVLSWFMPSQNFLSNWVTRIKNILLDHLSPWGDMDDTISNVLDRIVAALGEGGVESVEFPALSVPGTDFSTQSISVPLWPSGSSSLQYWVKLAVNLVSTIWVCNMVLNKIKSKIIGESVVEVEELENNDS